MGGIPNGDGSINVNKRRFGALLIRPLKGAGIEFRMESEIPLVEPEH